MKILIQAVIFFGLLTGLEIFAQEKPKAILFDEFGNISRAEMKMRVEKFNERLRKDAWSENFVDGMVFFYSLNIRTLKQDEDFIKHVLSDNCRDCRGWSSRLTFVNAGKSKVRRIQLWVIPRGAEPPEPEK